VIATYIQSLFKSKKNKKYMKEWLVTSRMGIAEEWPGKVPNIDRGTHGTVHP